MSDFSIAILTLDQVYASSLTTYSDAVQVARAHLARAAAGQDIKISAHCVSPDGTPKTASNGMQIETLSTDRLQKVDAVIVPGINYQGRQAFEQRLSASDEVLCWLSEQAQRTVPMVGNCTGTALLAEAGLLNERDAVTTPWWLSWFERRYPRVRIQAGQFEAHDGHLWTTSTPASCLSQSLQLVAHFCGRDIAASCARTLSEDVSLIRRFDSEPEHNDALVADAQHWLAQRYAQVVSMAELANRLCVSERTLSRRFNRAIGMGPQAFQQQLRIERACHLLQRTTRSVTEIAWEVGYADVSAFTRRFRRSKGMTPGRYRQAVMDSDESSLTVGNIPFQYESVAN